MISYEHMNRRVVSFLASRGGLASKAEIIQNTTGAKIRLIQAIDRLVAAGILFREGGGTKGNPHVFSLVARPSPVFSDSSDECVTVIV